LWFYLDFNCCLSLLLEYLNDHRYVVFSQNQFRVLSSGNKSCNKYFGTSLGPIKIIQNGMNIQDGDFTFLHQSI
jgi:hypothetical protein